MLLRPREPFHFGRSLKFILSPPALPGNRLFAPLLDYFEEGEYRRVVSINGQHVLYAVAAVPKSSEVALRVRILSGPTDGVTQRLVLALVERQFSASLDHRPFYRLAQPDPVLGKLIVRFRGMRIPQAPSVFETLVSAILEQQVNLAFAHKVKKALIDRYGGEMEFGGRRYNAFPEPAALAITTPQELRRLEISGPKARYLIGIARDTLDGTLDLEALRLVEPDIAHARLLKYKGVGPWTAQYVGMRALGHLDCLLTADVGLQKAIRYFYRLRKQPSPARIEKLAKRWVGWRSYATFYLWMTFWEDAQWKEGLRKELQTPRSGK
jgi:DNA-3-methyladenine glycosylase II